MNPTRLKPALASLALTACATVPPPPPAAVCEEPKPVAAPAPAPKKVAVDATAIGYQGLGPDSITPEVIAKFAPRPLPGTVTNPLQRLLDVRGTPGGILTSKGDRMVFSWNVTGTSHVWRLDGPMKMPIQLTGGEDTTSPLAITRDDKFVVVARDVGGQENPGLYLLGIEGGPLLEIQRKDKVQTQFAFVSDDDQYVYFTANDVKPDAYAVYRWSRKTKKRELVFGEPGLWSVADHRGEDLLLQKAVSSTQYEFWLWSAKDKKLTPVVGQNEQVRYSAQFAAKPGEYLITHDKQGDFNRLYLLAGGKETAISPDVKFDVARFAIDEERNRLVWVTNERGYFRVSLADARTLKPLPAPKFEEAENAYGVRFTRDGRFGVFNVDSSKSPARSVVVDFKSNKQAAWRPVMNPEVDLSNFSPATLESYPARDGAQIPMFVRRPAKCATEQCPVVVAFHGGPEGQAVSGYSMWAQAFVNAGFIYVEPNVRGSMGYGRTWLDADNGRKRLDVITDIDDAGKYIRTAWAKDGVAPKIGVTGGSYGGYSTFIAMTKFAGTYDAGVEEVGMSNLLSFIQNTAPYRRQLRISEYGDPEKDRDAMLQLSAVSYIDQLKAPLLMIQGVNDPRVPVGEALQMYGVLESRGVPGQLILLPNEGHGARTRGSQVIALGHTIQFFEKTLK